MSFDLNGGTVDGKTTYTVPATYGSIITLLTPVRDGYEFQYWEGSRYYGGDSYKVVGPHSFKAVWKKKDNPSPEPDPKPDPKPSPKPDPKPSPKPDPKPSPKSDNGGTVENSKTLAATGDTLPVAPAVATLLLSAAAIALSRVRMQATCKPNRGRHV